jgi:8-amino-7-oxononanoate synthase
MLATRTWGTGATGSRLVTGTTTIHLDLERELAEFLGSDDALVFSSGYAANLGVISAFGGTDALVVSDQLNHASIVDACRLSRSRIAITPHCDVDAVAVALAGRQERRAIVVTDSVFSTDGALAPLSDLAAVCRQHDALLVVDEAHAIGVLGNGGRGLVDAGGIGADDNVIRTITLSKSLGSQGGAVVASAAVTTDLRNTARTFIFDTGLAPSAVGAALRAVRLLRADPTLAAKACARAGLLAAELGAPPPTSTVVSLVLGDPRLADAVADRCYRDGVLVGCFRPPAVPAGTSRLRLTGRANLRGSEVRFGAEVIRDAVKELA